MSFNVNAIALAYRVRTLEEQVSFLQRHRILPTSYTCPDCNITCDEAKLKTGTSYFYFHCPGCKSKTSIRWLCYNALVIYVNVIQDWYHSFWKRNHAADFCAPSVLLRCNSVDPSTVDPWGGSWMGWCGWLSVVNWDQDQHSYHRFLPQDIQVGYCYKMGYRVCYRDIISERMFNTSQGYKIGGPGLTVEIDESMFGL